MSAFRRTLTTLASLISSLGMLIALSTTAYAHRAPLPDDSYPASTTSNSSASSSIWGYIAVAAAVLVLVLAARLTSAWLRHARRGSIARA